MAEPLGAFDTKHTYDRAAAAYEAASRFWEDVALRSVERLDLRPGDHVLAVPRVRRHERA